MNTLEKFLNALVHCDTVKVILTGCGEETYKTKDVYESIAGLGRELEALKNRLKEEDAELHRVDAENDELRNRYCWRKQSEEPAPNENVMIYDASQDCFSVVYGGFLDRGADVVWRPVDLPEKESK